MWLTLLTLTASILSCSTFSTTTGTLSNIFVCFSSLCIFVFVFKNKLPVDWWRELSLAEPHSLMSSAVCSALNTNKYWTQTLNINKYWTQRLNTNNYWTQTFNTNMYWTQTLSTNKYWIQTLNTNKYWTQTLNTNKYWTKY